MVPHARTKDGGSGGDTTRPRRTTTAAPSFWLLALCCCGGGLLGSNTVVQAQNNDPCSLCFDGSILTQPDALLEEELLGLERHVRRGGGPGAGGHVQSQWLRAVDGRRLASVRVRRGAGGPAPPTEAPVVVAPTTTDAPAATEPTEPAPTTDAPPTASPQDAPPTTASRAKSWCACNRWTAIGRSSVRRATWRVAPNSLASSWRRI